MGELLKTAAPFSRVCVDVHFNLITSQRVMVTWAMNREFNEPGPYVFELYRGFATNDTKRTKVAETIDQPFLYDYNPALSQFDRNLYYSIKLIDGKKREYWSQAATADMYWEHKDWLLAREIIRKETLILKRKAGTRGWLLHRRQWGDQCPDCVDKVTGQVTKPDCPTCYGTGFVGGYYEPIEHWVLMNPTQQLRRLDPALGVIQENIETVRTLAYPPVEANDVWVQANTNRRYRVMGDVAALARHRGIDLVAQIRLEELPQSSAVYKVPTP